MYKIFLKLIAALLGVISVLYYYLRLEIPIEISDVTIYTGVNILFAIAPFCFWISLGYLISERFQENKVLGCFMPTLMFVNLLHNWVWAFLSISWESPYQDLKITYPDPSDKRKMIIEQYLDQGAFGEDYRTIKAYQLLPGIRIIEDLSNEKNN